MAPLFLAVVDAFSQTEIHWSDLSVESSRHNGISREHQSITINLTGIPFDAYKPARERPTPIISQMDFRGKTTFTSELDQRTLFFPQWCSFDTLVLNTVSDIFLYFCRGKLLVYDRLDSAFTFRLAGVTFEKIKIKAVLSEFLAVESDVRTLSLANSSINGEFRMDKFVLPDTIDLSNVDMSNAEGNIDLTNYRPTDKICLINLYGTDVSRIRLDYRNFKLFFLPNDDSKEKQDEVIESIFVKLLEGFKNRGMEWSYRMLDVDYREYLHTRNGSLLGRVANWIDKHWWYYGYDKSKVLWNSLGFFSFCCLVNMLYWKKWIFSVYRIDNLEVMARNIGNNWPSLLKYLGYFVVMIISTGFVFWGIRLEVTKLRFQESIGISIMILIQHVIGIVCLAFIANLIAS